MHSLARSPTHSLTRVRTHLHTHSPSNPITEWWEDKRTCCNLKQKDLHVPPILSVAAWHDFFLPGQIADFQELQKRQQHATLYLRNMHHFHLGNLLGDITRLSLAWSVALSE